MQRNVIRYSYEFLGFMVTFRVGLGLGSGVMVGLGSGVRVGFRIMVRIRVSIGFRATRVAQSVARLSCRLSRSERAIEDRHPLQAVLFMSHKKWATCLMLCLCHQVV